MSYSHPTILLGPGGTGSPSHLFQNTSGRTRDLFTVISLLKGNKLLLLTGVQVVVRYQAQTLELNFYFLRGVFDVKCSHFLFSFLLQAKQTWCTVRFALHVMLLVAFISLFSNRMIDDLIYIITISWAYLWVLELSDINT